MIVLDTNVVSELMRSSPNATVSAWVARQPRGSLYSTTIVMAEILYGVAALPEAKRRDALAAAAGTLFAQDFAGRLLEFGQAAACHYAGIVTARRKQGRSISRFDALIAATALSADADVATRDTAGFDGCGLTLINPWEAQ